MTREAFEAFIKAPPFEMQIERFDDRGAWPGSYTHHDVDLAWQAWKASHDAALERAAALLNPDRSPSALFHQRKDCAEAIRAALAAPATAPESGAMTEIDYTDDDALRFVQRVLESDAPGADKKAARDMVVKIRTRVLKARASKSATAPEQQEQKNVRLDTDSNNPAPEQLRALACTVALGQRMGIGPNTGESNSDSKGAVALIRGMDEYGPLLDWFTHWTKFSVGTRLYVSQSATDDRHAQELLAQDITIAKMNERHAQEICAYSVTVDKLRAERKPMTGDELAEIFNHRAGFTTRETYTAFARAVEAHHGIGEKT